MDSLKDIPPPPLTDCELPDEVVLEKLTKKIARCERMLAKESSSSHHSRTTPPSSPSSRGKSSKLQKKHAMYLAQLGEMTYRARRDSTGGIGGGDPPGDYKKKKSSPGQASPLGVMEMSLRYSSHRDDPGSEKDSKPKKVKKTKKTKKKEKKMVSNKATQTSEASLCSNTSYSDITLDDEEDEASSIDDDQKEDELPEGISRIIKISRTNEGTQTAKLSSPFLRGPRSERISRLCAMYDLEPSRYRRRSPVKKEEQKDTEGGEGGGGVEVIAATAVATTAAVETEIPPSIRRKEEEKKLDPDPVFHASLRSLSPGSIKPKYRSVKELRGVYASPTALPAKTGSQSGDENGQVKSETNSKEEAQAVVQKKQVDDKNTKPKPDSTSYTIPPKLQGMKMLRNMYDAKTSPGVSSKNPYANVPTLPYVPIEKKEAKETKAKTEKVTATKAVPSQNPPARSVSPIRKIMTLYQTVLTPSVEDIDRNVVALVALFPAKMNEFLPKQSKMLHIFQSLGIHPVYVDGSNPKETQRRNKLFSVSGKWGVYPQVFVRKQDTGKLEFFGDFDRIESLNECSMLKQTLHAAIL